MLIILGQVCPNPKNPNLSVYWFLLQQDSSLVKWQGMLCLQWTTLSITVDNNNIQHQYLCWQHTMMTVFGTVALYRTPNIKASVEWFVILVGSFQRSGSFSSSWCAIPIRLLRGASNMLSKVLDSTLTFNQHTMGLHKYNWVDELLYNPSTSHSSTLFNRNQSVCFLSFSCLLCH